MWSSTEPSETEIDVWSGDPDDPLSVMGGTERSGDSVALPSPVEALASEVGGGTDWPPSLCETVPSSGDVEVPSATGPIASEIDALSASLLDVSDEDGVPPQPEITTTQAQTAQTAARFMKLSLPFTRALPCQAFHAVPGLYKVHLHPPCHDFPLPPNKVRWACDPRNRLGRHNCGAAKLA
jgi:hypothetical protein